MLAPRIIILMALHNGEEYLRPQLQSILDQTVPPQKIIFSDDGSKDGSVDLASDMMAGRPEIETTVLKGPCTGFADNFRNLILNAPSDADYIAFSDQDDLWLPKKLETAIAHLSKHDPDHPTLYGGRTETISRSGESVGFSPHFKKPPSFENALVQSIAGGNTMVMNAAAFSLLRASAERHHFASHDWWTYLMVTGAGGTMIYDPKAYVQYRQHNRNLVGANNSPRARWSRVRALLRGQWVAWNKNHVEGLEACRHLLTSQAQARFDRFKLVHQGSILQRLWALQTGGFYRQTRFGTLSLVVAAGMKLT